MFSMKSFEIDVTQNENILVENLKVLNNFTSILSFLVYELNKIIKILILS